mmetsp:Transcript_19524/g.45343  ORF Transcript_19524/g.45343 Transcript_19524/m.45343 type:complete len:397 (+) Transcript_19524:2-1192(+)
MHPAPRCRAAPARTAPGMQMQGGEGYEASQKLGRRGFMAALLTAAVAGSSVIGAPGGASAEDAGAKAFELVPTKDERWALGGFTENGETELLSGLASCDVVFLGEHHNQADDHLLQAKIVEGIAARKPGGVMIGLEMVQVQYQNALDEYIASTLPDKEADAALFEGVQWATRWQWSFEGYLPLLQLARREKIPLVALNVDSETLAKVRFGGLEMLSEAEKDVYVDDRKGFISFSKVPGFMGYVQEVVMPSYEFHASMGLLGPNPKQANFYSSRVLWDEGMSNIALRSVEKNPGKTMVVIEGADHVKYRLGSVGRMERMAKTRNLQNFKVKSVLLNPTAYDSLIEDSSQPLALASAFTPAGAPQAGPAYPLADFIWFSSVPPLSLVPAEARLRFLRN